MSFNVSFSSTTSVQVAERSRGVTVKYPALPYHPKLYRNEDDGRPCDNGPERDDKQIVRRVSADTIKGLRLQVYIHSASEAQNILQTFSKTVHRSFNDFASSFSPTLARAEICLAPALSLQIHRHFRLVKISFAGFRSVVLGYVFIILMDIQTQE